MLISCANMYIYAVHIAYSRKRSSCGYELVCPSLCGKQSMRIADVHRCLPTLLLKNATKCRMFRKIFRHVGDFIWNWDFIHANISVQLRSLPGIRWDTFKTLLADSCVFFKLCLDYVTTCFSLLWQHWFWRHALPHNMGYKFRNRQAVINCEHVRGLLLRSFHSSFTAEHFNCLFFFYCYRRPQSTTLCSETV